MLTQKPCPRGVRAHARETRREEHATPGCAVDVTAADLTGLTLAGLAERVPERRHPWLELVVEDEVRRGRIVENGDGLLRLRREMFDEVTFLALRAWEPPT